MKQVDIGSNCYAHLIDNVIYLYVNNEFTEMMHIDNIETTENPIPLIVSEIEISSRPSLYKCIQLMNWFYTYIYAFIEGQMVIFVN